jgi:ABC-type transporter MlaC component|tara:strand:- start:1307 stop:1933 length:627 start_codon:yes stop_codon:yes gene_type:complete
MKKYFFLFFIYLFSSLCFLDTEVEDYVNAQHEEIFNFLNDNEDLFDQNKDLFLEEFEERFSKLIPPEEISKRVMGKKIFTIASKNQISRFNEKFKNTLLDSYSGALSNIEAANISIESHYHPNERMDLAVVQLNTEFSGRKFKLIYKMKKIKIEDSMNWRVVGIVLDGIDLVSLYRKQFSTLVSSNDNNLDLAIESWSIEEDTLNLED